MSFITKSLKFAENILESVDSNVEKLIPVPNQGVAIPAQMDDSNKDIESRGGLSTNRSSRPVKSVSVTQGGEQISNSVQSLSVQLEESQRREAALEDQIRESFKDLSKYRTLLSDARKRLSEVDQDAFMKLRQSHDSLQLRCEAVTRDYEALRSASEASILEARTQLRSAQLQIESHSTALERLKLEHKEREEALSSELDRLVASNAALEASLRSGGSGSTTNTGDVVEIEAALMEARSTIASLDIMVSRLKSETSISARQSADAAAEVERARARAAAAEAEVQQLRRTLVVSQESSDPGSRKQLAELREELAAAQRDSATTTQEVVRLTEELLESKGRLKASQHMFIAEQRSAASLRAALDDAQRRVAELQLLERPSRTREKERTRVKDGFLGLLDAFLLDILSLLKAFSKVRLVVFSYFLVLQLWCLFILFFHKHQDNIPVAGKES